jgi:hypothetical protein
MNRNENKILSDYPEVLNPKDIQEVLGIGRRQTYELLNQIPPPFHIIRVGRSIKVSKVAFENWLIGNGS